MGNQRKIGAALSYAAQLVQILVNLVYTPVMLRLVGQGEYGLYTMVMSVVSYLNLLNFGFNSAYMRFYARCKAKEDRQGIASLNGMFVTIFSVMALVAAVAGGCFVWNIKPLLGSNLTAAEMDTARILMILMVINLVMTFPNSVFDCYITSQERFVFQKLLVILQQLLNPVIALPLLVLGYGSVAMISVTTGLTMLIFVINMCFCLGKLRMQICFRGFRLSLLKEMWAFTFFIFLNQIIDQLNWSVDKFLLGRMVGTVAVAVYGVASTINLMFRHFATAVSGVFTPKVNAMVAQKDGDSALTGLFVRVGRIQFFVLALILIGFVSLGRPFIRLWGGMEYDESYQISLLLICPAVISLIQHLGIEIQRAKNLHKARSVVYLFIALGNVALSIPLIRRFGATGAALGTAVTLLLGTGLFMNIYYHKKVGLDILRFWKSILSILPSLIPPVVVGVVAMCFGNITGWLELIVWGVLITAVYGASIYLLGMNRSEKQLIRNILKRSK